MSDERTFSHSGDIGDIIYAMPTVRAFGGGHLRLFPTGYTGTRMTQQRAESIASLLRRQDYIFSCEYSDGPEGRNLDYWRRCYVQGWTLADMCLSAFGFPHCHRDEQWLTVSDPYSPAPVIIHRSPRCHNSRFPWKRVLDQYSGQIAMVGAPSEHADFVERFGDVPYYPTSDLYELAQVIAGCRLFVGNQSSPYAISEGLKVRSVLEGWFVRPDCCYYRDECVYGWDEGVQLPEL